jgi:hypothetical protein
MSIGPPRAALHPTAEDLAVKDLKDVVIPDYEGLQLGDLLHITRRKATKLVRALPRLHIPPN